MGTLPIVDPDQRDGGTTMPRVSPGNSMPVFRPNPKRSIHFEIRSLPSASAMVTTPTLEERERIWWTLSFSVPRGSASWI
jgi:hypothetical protein